MKKRTLLLIFSIILSFPAISQVRDYYIDIVPQSYNEFSFYYTALVTTESEAGTLCVGDSTVRFDYEMSIVNYMSSKGWTLVNMVETLYPEMVANLVDGFVGKDAMKNMRQHHYFMKKQASSYEEAFDGITLIERKVADKVKKDERKRKHDARKKPDDGQKDDLYYKP